MGKKTGSQTASPKSFGWTAGFGRVPWQQFGRPIRIGLGQPRRFGKQPCQVAVRIEPVLLRRLNQAENHGAALRAPCRVRKKEVLPGDHKGLDTANYNVKTGTLIPWAKPASGGGSSGGGSNGGSSSSGGSSSGGEWYADSVAWAASHEVMNGMGDGDFSPDAEASRAQIAQLLFNLDGATADGNLASFDDVNAGDWYADAVTWMVENGIANGMGDGFGANEDVTREQLAVMLYNYTKYKGYDTTVNGSIAGFPDAGDADGYARSALAWAVGAGLISGTTDENGNIVLDPQGSATRGQIAAIIERFVENVVN